MSEKSFLRNVAQFSGTKNEENYKKREREEGRREGGEKRERRKQDFKFYPSYYTPRIWIHPKYVIYLEIIFNDVCSSVKFKVV